MLNYNSSALVAASRTGEVVRVSNRTVQFCVQGVELNSVARKKLMNLWSRINILEDKKFLGSGGSMGLGSKGCRINEIVWTGKYFGGCRQYR